MLVQNPKRLTFRTGDLQKLRLQPGLAHRALPRVHVQVERPALTASMARSFPLIDRRPDPVNLKQASERETAGASTDDSDVLNRVVRHTEAIGPQGSATVEKLWRLAGHAYTTILFTPH